MWCNPIWWCQSLLVMEILLCPTLWKYDLVMLIVIIIRTSSSLKDILPCDVNHVLDILALLEGKPHLISNNIKLIFITFLSQERSWKSWWSFVSLAKLKKKETCAADDSMEIARVMAGQVSHHPQAPYQPLGPRAQPSWSTPLWNTRLGGAWHFLWLHNPSDHWPMTMGRNIITESKVGLVWQGIPAVRFLSDSWVEISAEWSQSYAAPRFGLETTSSSHCRCCCCCYWPTPGCCKTAWLHTVVFHWHDTRLGATQISCQPILRVFTSKPI